MRKSILSMIVLLIIGIVISGCQNSNSRKSININIGQSKVFSSAEIDEAVNSVIKKFNKDFRGCELTDLWYDESKLNSEVEGYMNYGRGSNPGVNKSNIIVLLSNFKVDSSYGDGSLNKNSTYTDWKWILIRDSENGKWTIDDWGY